MPLAECRELPRLCPFRLLYLVRKRAFLISEVVVTMVKPWIKAHACRRWKHSSRDLISSPSLGGNNQSGLKPSATSSTCLRKGGPNIDPSRVYSALLYSV